MADHIVLPDPVVHDLVGVQRNFESLRKLISSISSETIILPGGPSGIAPGGPWPFYLRDVGRIRSVNSLFPTGDYGLAGGKDCVVDGGEGATAWGTNNAVTGDEGPNANGAYNTVEGDYGANTNGESNNVTGDDGPNANGVSNNVTGDYGPNANGESNNVEGDDGPNANGESNQVTGNDGINANGLSNNVTANNGSNANGKSNTVTGNDGAWANGQSNEVTADGAGAVGEDAVSDLYSAMAFGFGYPHQGHLIGVQAQTTNATAKALLLANGDPVAVPSNELWKVRVDAVAKQTAGAGSGLAGWRLDGVIGYPGGVLSMIDVTEKHLWGFGNGLTWDMDLVAGSGLEVTAFGQASRTIKWVATIQATRLRV